ncbi:class I SAM-dependent methyltransferase [Gemmata sp.]|uniref:class I SAM-dependent methyltransferase n=1 Tax=Gemmata sp. TaxID=1914242 RepID=UPI003F70BDFC
MPRDTCPVCDAPAGEAFLRRAGVPVHQNLPFASAAAARGIARGDLEMRACGECGFVFNAAFDPARVSYGPGYENSQDHSPAFTAHIDSLVDHLVTAAGVRGGRIVEVGCGQGGFLRKLLAHQGNASTAVGYDPAYAGLPESPDGRARFDRDFYGPGTAVPADAVVCRHVIEHVPDPLALLRTVRAGVGASGSTRVFFETPCAEWILRGRVTWDLFYEHCSLFTAHSLGRALTRAGFGVTGVRHVFGGQYLWAEATSCGEGAPPPVVRTDELAAAFGATERAQATAWRAAVESRRADGPVYAWGAGAKGVTFANLADPAAERLAGVVDVNPAKQGRFVPGTGHPIVPPAAAVRARAVLVFNPNYVAEVADTLAGLGSAAEVVDLSALGGGDPCGW